MPNTEATSRSAGTPLGTDALSPLRNGQSDGRYRISGWLFVLAMSSTVAVAVLASAGFRMQDQLSALQREVGGLESTNIIVIDALNGLKGALRDIGDNNQGIKETLEREVEHMVKLSETVEKPPVVDEFDSEKEEMQRMFAVLLGLGLVVILIVIRLIDYMPWVVKAPMAVALGVDLKRAKEVSLYRLVTYRLDVWFSTHPYSKQLALLYLTLLLILLGMVGIYLVGRVTLYDAFWAAVEGVGFNWSFANDNDKTGQTDFSALSMRLIALMVSIGGALLTALTLGLVSESISHQIEDWKKGKSDVLESGHTLILGWSDKVLPVLDQVCRANAWKGGKRIVVLAERSKEEMEETILKMAFPLHGSKIICRSGEPLQRCDVERVSANRASAVIVPASNDVSSCQSDARVLRIVLNLIGVHEELIAKGHRGLRGHVVVEVMDHDLAKVIKLVAGKLVKTVVSHDIVGRLMLQNALKPGLASVWENLLGFDGDEFHMKTWKRLTGKSFKDVFVSFDAAIPLGIKSGLTGDVLLNPTDDYYIQDKDQIIVLAEDEDTYVPGEPSQTVGGNPPRYEDSSSAQKILFVGWRRRMDDLIRSLDTLAVEGTELWLYNEVPIEERTLLLRQSGLDPLTSLNNIKLVYKEAKLVGEMINRQKLDELRPDRFSSIIILADQQATGSNRLSDADSQNLAALLLLRDIQRKRLGKFPGLLGGSTWYECMAEAAGKTVVICEILDSRTRTLLEDWKICEFVLSNELVSMVLAMESENADISHVLEELFDSNGSMMSVYPAAKFIKPGEILSFYDVMVRGRKRREIVIGYKAVGERTPMLNPKDKKARVMSLETTDTFLVIAEFWAKKSNPLGLFIKSEYVDSKYAPRTL